MGDVCTIEANVGVSTYCDGLIKLSKVRTVAAGGFCCMSEIKKVWILDQERTRSLGN